ncbi:MAG TPA: RagB/SusD family nutrient uptake outer membrane protein [Niastella sp.]|nr:RagB/SusD family nutrient uptake outer membrane protein [Niastella sp.]
MKYIKQFLFLLIAFITFSCTKLDERFRSELEQGNSGSISASQLLIGTYTSIGSQFTNGDFWQAQQQTSDETIAPTRGPDWDDNGQWRALHAHTWNADQSNLRGAFQGLLSTQFQASNVLKFNPSGQQAAEARFIRALSMAAVLDGWDQVPYREDVAADFKILPVTYKGTAAFDFIVGELNAILNDLPDNGPAYVANKNGARALLMKLYLNKGVYANRAAPTFDAADMNQVITLADQIISSGKYSLSDIFFDNFAPDNDTRSKENIYTFYNKAGDRGNDIRNTAFAVSHYNMNPGGWNGFSTLSDFYDKFEATDQRKGMYYTYPGALPNPGKRVNVGFLVGQQYNLTTDAPLKDRKDNPLVFTKEVKIRETDPNTLEVTGIRVIKYPFDYGASGDQKNNDWALFRLADVMLMKAEALMRTGKDAEALLLVNQIRVKRLATPLTAMSLDQLLDERGREMYWEGWRRQDLIRFGKFLQPWQEKAASDPKVLLFPIPNTQLAVNPNLTQNPGY